MGALRHLIESRRDEITGSEGFLDRGELAKLLDAADSEQAPLAAEADRLGRRDWDRKWDDDDDDDRGGGEHGRGGRRRRRGGLLGDLIDFD